MRYDPPNPQPRTSPLFTPMPRGMFIGLLVGALAGTGVVLCTGLLLDWGVAWMVACGLPSTLVLTTGLGAISATRARVGLPLFGMIAALANAPLTGVVLGLITAASVGGEPVSAVAGMVYVASYGAVILSPVLLAAGFFAGVTILAGAAVADRIVSRACRVVDASPSCVG